MILSFVLDSFLILLIGGEYGHVQVTCSGIRWEFVKALGAQYANI